MAVGGLIFFIGLFLGWKAVTRHYTAGQKRNLFPMVGGSRACRSASILQFVARNAPHTCSVSFSTKSVGTNLDYGIMVGYFLVILALGTWFGRYNKSTRDFFFGGQKFSVVHHHVIVATTVGSYSFIKYSRVAYKYGLSSSQTYLNDWFWCPCFYSVGYPSSFSRRSFPPRILRPSFRHDSSGDGYGSSSSTSLIRRH